MFLQVASMHLFTSFMPISQRSVSLNTGVISNQLAPITNGRCRVVVANLKLAGDHNQYASVTLDNNSPSKLLRVAYQGVPGAYSEGAVMKSFPDCATVPSQDFEDAIKAVEMWGAEKAVIPVENSLGGSIHRNYDLLIRHQVSIVGEIHLAVDHCLLGLPGVRKEEIKRVLSHPQALDQCEMSVKKLGRVAGIQAVKNTAYAAKIVASERIRQNGAIASARAAAIYGLDILVEKFQDRDGNVTRFLVLSREPIIPSDNRCYKTSIVFTLRGGPGALPQALSVFAHKGINLCKVESRPLRKYPLNVVGAGKQYISEMHFDYFFYMDFEACIAESRVEHALECLQKFTNYLRILGCYEIDNTLL